MTRHAHAVVVLATAFLVSGSFPAGAQTSERSPSRGRCRVPPMASRICKASGPTTSPLHWSGQSHSRERMSSPTKSWPSWSSGSRRSWMGAMRSSAMAWWRPRSRRTARSSRSMRRPGTTARCGVERDIDNRTSLITNPANGRLPAMKPATAERLAELGAHMAAHPADSWEDRPLSERCITFGMPNLFAGYNSYYQIFQTKDHVVILQELIHDARIIPSPTRRLWTMTSGSGTAMRGAIGRETPWSWRPGTSLPGATRRS